MAILETLGSMAFQGGINAFNDWRVNTQNKELAKYSFRQNKKMWELNNMYNSPAQQMQRLRDAGLNPNLVYGNGAVGNTSSKTPEYNAPNVQSTIAPGDPLETLSKFQNTQILQQQQRNLKAQEELIRSNAAKSKADAVNAGKRAGILDSEAELKRIEASFAQQLGQYQVQQAGQALTNAQKQALILELEQHLKAAELRWRKQGMTSNDHILWRQIMQHMNDAEIREADLMGSPLRRLGEWMMKLPKYEPEWVPEGMKRPKTIKQ